MSRIIQRSRSCQWNEPRQPLHSSERYMRHGPVLPMEEPSLLQRLFGWGRR